jgi:hypothetical protein
MKHFFADFNHSAMVKIFYHHGAMAEMFYHHSAMVVVVEGCGFVGSPFLFLGMPIISLLNPATIPSILPSTSPPNLLKRQHPHVAEEEGHRRITA